ncbi:uncharacterized protein LOC114961608 [Acropora millepora]|uniref:uncharacterized protein LOC114961608 n=1 Tax=Acropora millepora TaxID=45264 RepID=UPI001CF19D30|nr:uncharacterized protein LOC114961608 [Acropora millepora]
MRRSCSKAVVYFHILVALVSFSKCVEQINKRSANFVGAQKDGHITQTRSLSDPGPSCNITNGVYIERWDRIDYKRVKFLLADERYPNLPSLTLCLPTYEQPQQWTNFFGARVHTYFSPLQTGNHYFYLSSNAGSELFLSTDDKEKDKTMICGVDGGFPTEPYEYDRYAGQTSNPIYLQKGKFYYMESIMKDDHQADHLEVGLKTPDGSFYNVVPSQFLWINLPLPPEQNATYRALLIKVAAEAGAKAGLSLGAKFAMRTGARAGAKAGARAGMEAGASAGSTAGFRAAVNMTTRTLQDALNSLHDDTTHPYKINVKDGEVVSVTGPGIEATGRAAAGATSASGSAGAAGTAGTTGSSGYSSSSSSSGTTSGSSSGSSSSGGSSSTSVTAGSAGATGAGGGAGGGGNVVGSPGVGTSGATGAAAGGGNAAGAGVSGASGAVGIGGQTGTAGSSQVTSSSGGAGGAGVGGGGGAMVGGGKETSEEGITDYFSPDRELTYTPKPGEDPQAKAKELVWRAGGARKIVANAMYTFHSFNIPYPQEKFWLNQCWRSINGKFVLDQWCNVFVARIPSLYGKGEDLHSVSFESVCFPGYFMRQKNFHFLLQKRDGSDVFDKDSSFHIFSVMKLARNFLLNSWHKDWYICQSEKRKKYGTQIILDYYNGQPDVLDRCTFVLSPIWTDKYQYCKHALGPVIAPEINGQPLPHPPHLVETTPAPPFVLPSCIPVCPADSNEARTQGAAAIPSSSGVSIVSSPSKKMCVALNFVNRFGSPFTLFSSMKHEGYFVSRSGFRLKLIIDRPELHNGVTFHATDPEGKRQILLNGSPNITVPLVSDCTMFTDVLVTGKEDLLPSTITEKPSVLPSTTSKPVGPPSLPPSPPLVPAPPAAPPSAPWRTSSPHDKGSVHYHYHYHGRTSPHLPDNACPSNCANVVQCQPTCPIHCCNRD